VRLRGRDPLFDEVTGLLSVSEVIGRLGDFQLGPVTFELGPGEQLGIIGKSGSGKSTLLRLLSGFLRLEAGNIRTPNHRLAAGETVTDLAAYRREVVYVAQHTALWPHMTVYENVAFASRMHGLVDTEKRVDALLHELELDRLRDRRSWEISGGEARRTMVARALAVQPRVLLCDEIEAGLDPVRAQRLMTLISHVCLKQGTAIVVVTHNVATIERFTRGVIILDAGAVVEEGYSDVVMKTPCSQAGGELVEAWKAPSLILPPDRRRRAQRGLDTWLPNISEKSRSGSDHDLRMDEALAGIGEAGFESDQHLEVDD
jgi:ABC-type methionine transport system ATPase subunit